MAPGAHCAAGAIRPSVGKKGFVAEDAVEGGTADAELPCSAELVAAIQVQDVLDVLLNDGVEIEGASLCRGMHLWHGLEAGGQGEVAGADDAIDGLKERSFEDSG